MNDLPAWVHLVFHRRVRYVAAWLLALGLAWARMENAHRSFQNPNRVDGNSGHTTIDFGGQWPRIVATPRCERLVLLGLT